VYGVGVGSARATAACCVTVRDVLWMDYSGMVGKACLLVRQLT
jgi:hypothetical protein